MRVLFLLLLLLSSPLACRGEAGLSSAAQAGAAGQQPDSQQPKQQDEFVPVSQLPPQDQLPAARLLIGAYAFVWIVLFAYLVSVSRRLSNVQREVERLESDIARGTRT
jgi:CcmD family protein